MRHAALSIEQYRQTKDFSVRSEDRFRAEDGQAVAAIDGVTSVFGPTPRHLLVAWDRNYDADQIKAAIMRVLRRD